MFLTKDEALDVADSIIKAATKGDRKRRAKQNDCPLELLGHHCRDSWHYDCAMEAHLFGGTIASASTERIRAAIPELRKSDYYMAEDMLAAALSVLKQRVRKRKGTERRCGDPVASPSACLRTRGKSKAELLAHYATREPVRFAQIDGFTDHFDSVVVPNDHGVAIIGGGTYELMTGMPAVRILIKPEADPAKVITILTDAIDWVKDGAIEDLLNPPDPTKRKSNEDVPF